MAAAHEQTREAGPSAPPRVFEGCSTFYEAAANYLESHITIESSAIIEITLEDLLAATSLNEAFLVPIRRALFDYHGALGWMSFLYHARQQAVESYPETGERPPPELSLAKCMAEIASVYDIAMENEIWTHYGGDSASSDESDDEDPAGAADEPAEEPLDKSH